jgi:hypothetical protein
VAAKGNHDKGAAAVSSPAYQGTRLTGRRLKAARAAWISAAMLVLVPTVFSWPAYFGALRQVCDACLVVPDFAAALVEAGASVDVWAAWNTARTVVTTLGWAGIGLLIFARRSDDRRALVTSALLVLAAPGVGGLPFVLKDVAPAWVPFVQLTNFLSGVSIFTLIMTLPTGRFAPRWTLGAWLYLVAVFGPNSFWPGTPLAFSTWPPWATGVFTFIPMFATMVIVPLYRYLRVLTTIERQQAKWVVAGLLGAAAGIFATTFISGRYIELGNSSAGLQLRGTLIQDVGYFLGPLLIPFSIGVAILRSQLWEIDVIFRRALIYSVLSAVLALAYFGSVLVLESVFRLFTGQGQNALVVVLSTLTIAALIVPLRQRVQQAIDRRFFRRKYDAARTLAGFAASARDETDLQHLSARLVAVVDETMQPETVGLWLRAGETNDAHRQPGPGQTGAASVRNGLRN